MSGGPTVLNMARLVPRIPALDAVLALIAATVGVLELLEYTDTVAGAVLLGGSLGLPVLFRTAWPLPASIAGGLSLPVVSSLVPGSESIVSIAVPFVTLYSVGRLSSWRTMAVAAASDFGAVGLWVRGDESLGWVEGLLFNVAFLVALAVGRASREMQYEADVVRAEAARDSARAAQERETAVEAAKQDERLRMAREIHDVLGHAVSVMGLQAAGVRRRLRAEQELESQALLAVEDTGRQAVEELRRLLGVLRAPTEDEGGLGSSSRAAAVVEEVRAAGLAVEASGLDAVDDLPPALALTAVRIVQEGLTNALRHAPGSCAQVTVTRGGGWLTVTVADDGSEGRAGANGSGFGLVGMAERVAAFGGQLEVGPHAPRGFVLRARIPEPTS